MSRPEPPPAGPAQPVPLARLLRPDLALIAAWIPRGANVLDLGCGDGALLDHLRTQRSCTGYGVEIDAAAVLACARRGVDILQCNIEDGLGMFRGGHFDVVVLSMAIQATLNTQHVVREMSDLADVGIVSINNFGHWRHIWSILRGRMPVTAEMPYQWYDTPNLHLATVEDFEVFLARLQLKVLDRVLLAHGRPVSGWFATRRATQAIYRIQRQGS